MVCLCSGKRSCVVSRQGGLLNGKISLARIHNMSPHMDVYFNFIRFKFTVKISLPAKRSDSLSIHTVPVPSSTPSPETSVSSPAFAPSSSSVFAKAGALSAAPASSFWCSW